MLILSTSEKPRKVSQGLRFKTGPDLGAKEVITKIEGGGKRGHEFVREQGGVYLAGAGEGLKGGKRKEKCNYIITSKVRKERSKES